MSTNLDERKRTKTGPVHTAYAANPRIQQWVKEHPHAAFPSDIIHDATGEDFAQSMLDREHCVDWSDPNYITVIHKTNLTQVKYPRNKNGQPYTITMRARIARTLKLMLFFCVPLLCVAVWAVAQLTDWL